MNNNKTTYVIHDLAHARGMNAPAREALLAMQEKINNLETLALRLALDLECVILSPDKWKDQAYDTLSDFRLFMNRCYPRDHVSPLGKD